MHWNIYDLFIFKNSKYELMRLNKPPHLVQMYNGTTDGLGYQKVLELSMQILLHGQLASVRTVKAQWGKRYNSSIDTNPNNTSTSIQLHCIQAASPHLTDKTTSKPQPNCYVYKSSPHQPPYCTYIWNKYPKRVALATKYLSKYELQSYHLNFVLKIAGIFKVN